MVQHNAECPNIPISSGLSRFCLKIPNPDATSVGIGKSRFLIPESYFRQINKETKYLTWICVKVKVWTKKTANKNPLPSVSGCIAFVESLLRLVTSIECVLLYPVSQKSVSTKWRVYKGKIWTPDIRHQARILYLLILW